MAEARAEGSTGRPRITVNKEQIEILRSLRITWEEISLMMGVSVKTLQRRARDTISNDFLLLPIGNLT